MKWYNKLGKFFAVIFSIIYSALLVGVIILFFLSSFFKGDIYVDVLKSIDLKEIKLSDIDSRLVDVFGKDATIEDALVSSLESAGIDSTAALEIINNPEVKEVVGEFVGECINYSVNPTEVPEIDSNDIEKVLDNIDTSKITDKEINKNEIKEYVDEINVNVKDYLKEGFNYADRIN